MATTYNSTKAINTTSPIKFKSSDDITVDNLNQIISWLSISLKNIEVLIKSLDDRVTNLE